MTPNADYVRYLNGEVVGFFIVTEGPQKFRGKTVVEIVVDAKGKLEIGDEVGIMLSPNDRSES